MDHWKETNECLDETLQLMKDYCDNKYKDEVKEEIGELSSASCTIIANSTAEDRSGLVAIFEEEHWNKTNKNLDKNLHFIKHQYLFEKSKKRGETQKISDLEAARTLSSLSDYITSSVESGVTNYKDDSESSEQSDVSSGFVDGEESSEQEEPYPVEDTILDLIESPGTMEIKRLEAPIDKDLETFSGILSSFVEENSKVIKQLTINVKSLPAPLQNKNVTFLDKLDTLNKNVSFIEEKSYSKYKKNVQQLKIDVEKLETHAEKENYTILDNSEVDKSLPKCDKAIKQLKINIKRLNVEERVALLDDLEALDETLSSSINEESYTKESNNFAMIMKISKDQKKDVENIHFYNVLDTKLSSEKMHKVLRWLQKKDVLDLFAEPVEIEKVPDYLDIIKNPMDFATMKAKIDNFEYGNLDDLETDFLQIIDNCLSYNEENTYIYQAGVILRESGNQIFDKERAKIKNKVTKQMKKNVGSSESSDEKVTFLDYLGDSNEKSSTSNQEKSSECKNVIKPMKINVQRLEAPVGKEKVLIFDNLGTSNDKLSSSIKEENYSKCNKAIKQMKLNFEVSVEKEEDKLFDHLGASDEKFYSYLEDESYSKYNIAMKHLQINVKRLKSPVEKEEAIFQLDI